MGQISKVLVKISNVLYLKCKVFAMISDFKVFGQNVKYFGRNLKDFGQNINGFGQNFEEFSQNINVFNTNLLAWFIAKKPLGLFQSE